MPTKQFLLEKKALYEAKKVELSFASYEDKIEQELAKYRVVLQEKFASENAEETKKVDYYLACVNEMLSEVDENDIEQDSEQSPSIVEELIED